MKEKWRNGVFSNYITPSKKCLSSWVHLSKREWLKHKESQFDFLHETSDSFIPIISLKFPISSAAHCVTPNLMLPFVKVQKVKVVFRNQFFPAISTLSFLHTFLWVFLTPFCKVFRYLALILLNSLRNILYFGVIFWLPSFYLHQHFDTKSWIL